MPKHTTPKQHAALVLMGWAEDDAGDYWHEKGTSWIFPPSGAPRIHRAPHHWRLATLNPQFELLRKCPIPLAIYHAKRYP